MKKLSEKQLKGAVRRLSQVLILVSKIKTVPFVFDKNINYNVDLVFVTNQKISSLNKKYRNKNEATDILSFQAPLVFREKGYLGELVISYPMLCSQAKERDLTFDMELLILLVHGVLHLVGFDHEKNKKEAKKMAVLETRALQRLAPATWVSKSKGRCLRGLIERVE